MRLQKYLTGLLTGLGLFALSAQPALAQEYTFRLQSFLPAQATIPKRIIDVWADAVEADSGGRIKIDRFASMQLGGKPPELLDQAINGTVDIVWNVVGYTPGRYPRSEVFELPFLMKDSVALSCAFWEMFEIHMADTEFKDLHVMGAWVHGRGLFHTTDPVEEIADLRGMKIRGASRMVVEMLEEVGATPVPMPAPAITEALSKGVIDGAALPWEVTATLKVPDLVENHTEFDGASLYTLTFILAMNKEKYASLPVDLREVIDRNSGLSFAVFAGGIHIKADAEVREATIDAGNNIIIIGGDDLRQWQEAVAPVYAEWVSDMREKGIDGEALIAEARKRQDACAARLAG